MKKTRKGFRRKEIPWLYTIEEASKILGISPLALRELIKQGFFPVYQSLKGCGTIYLKYHHIESWKSKARWYTTEIERDERW